MEENTKFVRFDIWCKQCEHCDTKEELEPCNECLSYPARENTTKPLYFKEASTNKIKKK